MLTASHRPSWPSRGAAPQCFAAWAWRRRSGPPPGLHREGAGGSLTAIKSRACWRNGASPTVGAQHAAVTRQRSGGSHRYPQEWKLITKDVAGSSGEHSGVARGRGSSARATFIESESSLREQGSLRAYNHLKLEAPEGTLGWGRRRSSLTSPRRGGGSTRRERQNEEDH